MKYLYGLVVALYFTSCVSDHAYKNKLYDSEYFHRSVKKLTDIMVYDIFSPPVASRTYVYPAVAAYEIMAQLDDGYSALAGQLNGLTPIPKIDTSSFEDPYLSAIKVYTILGQRLLFSEDKMEEFRSDLDKGWRKMGVPEQVIQASESYAQRVADHIFNWIDQDGYKQTRTMPKFSIQSDPGRWEPTPPDYMEGIEPHWDKIRTLVLDSAAQFIPLPPPVFDTIPGSAFYEQARDVYEAVNLEDEEFIAIASFWDCNPFVSHHKGHVMFGTKKISPGGHWMGIAGLAARQSGLSPMETIATYTLVSIGLFDAFINCWNEKYRCNLIRPETYINRYLDPMWRPVLQTPPFPEHTSGHSVISTTAAVLLTALFGPDYAFEDTVEMEYGLPARQFDSFIQASQEAAISRLYGGIHYMPAITEGVKQGEGVGNFIIQNLMFKK